MGDDSVNPDSCVCLSCTDADRIVQHERLSNLEKNVSAILEKITATELLIAKVIEEVKPTLDELMNSSLVKMMGIGKKK